MFFDLPKNFKFYKYISSGYHGDIYLVYDTSYKILKVFNDIKVGKNETLIVSKLKHPNIISHIKSYSYLKYWCIEMPYYQKGSLYSRLLRTTISDNECAKWLKQLKSAIYYMHQLKYTHNDLKLNNILLDVDNNVVIIDFGCALENTYNFTDDINSLENIQYKFKNKKIASKL